MIMTEDPRLETKQHGASCFLAADAEQNENGKRGEQPGGFDFRLSDAKLM